MATLDRIRKTEDKKPLSISIDHLIGTVGTFSKGDQAEFIQSANAIISAISARKKETELARGWLQSCFPNIFGSQPRLLSKPAFWEIKKVWQELPETAKHHLTYRAIKRVYKEIEAQADYISLCRTLGTPRYDASGVVINYVTEESIDGYNKKYKLLLTR